MIDQERIEQLQPYEARAIIEALRKGSVPMEYVPFFTVGRQNWLKFIEDDLDHYIAEGGAKVRFINGDYGDGKTHFMSVVRHMAMQKGFAVSYVVLTRDVPMHKFEVVYREIIKGLQMPEGFPEARVAGVQGIGIRGLLNAWIRGLALEGEPEGAGSQEEKVNALADELRSLAGMDPNFANGLVGLLKACTSPAQEPRPEEGGMDAREVLFQWFEGGKVGKKDLKPFQIFESLNKTNSKRFLQSLLVFLKYLGYRGLVLLLDELETVIAHSASVRNAAYENVRLLIDNTEQAQYLHIFFSIIPDLILSEKGLKSYDALWSRVRSIGEGIRLNYRSILIDLHRTPLTVQEMIELGLALRRIHEISYRWQASERINEKLLEEICATQKQMGLLSEVRLFIKQVVRILDMAEQGMPVDEELDLTEQILAGRRELEQEKLEQLQPRWDS